MSHDGHRVWSRQYHRDIVNAKILDDAKNHRPDSYEGKPRLHLAFETRLKRLFMLSICLLG